MTISASCTETRTPRSPWDWEFQTHRRPLIIAHGRAPAIENTISGFRAAHDAGADVIEVDVRLTMDEQVVCFHDDVVDVGGSLREVMDLAHNELIQAAPKVPTFEMVARLGFPIFLDIKETEPSRVARLIEKVVQVIDCHRLLIGVRSCVESKNIHNTFPEICQVGLIQEVEDLLYFAQQRPREWARLHHPRASAESIARLSAAGLRIVVTCGIGTSATGEIELESFQQLLALGPDAVIVNDPLAALNLLSQ